MESGKMMQMRLISCDPKESSKTWRRRDVPKCLKERHVAHIDFYLVGSVNEQSLSVERKIVMEHALFVQSILSFSTFLNQLKRVRNFR